MHAFGVSSVVERLRSAGGGYEIVHESDGLELGVYVLVAPEPDRQQPHEDDEIYIGLEGTGVLEVGDESVPIDVGRGDLRRSGRRAPLHGVRAARRARDLRTCARLASPPRVAILALAGCGGGSSTPQHHIHLTPFERRGKALFISHVRRAATSSQTPARGGMAGPALDSPWQASRVRETIADGPADAGRPPHRAEGGRGRRLRRRRDEVANLTQQIVQLGGAVALVSGCILSEQVVRPVRVVQGSSRGLVRPTRNCRRHRRRLIPMGSDTRRWTDPGC